MFPGPEDVVGSKQNIFLSSFSARCPQTPRLGTGLYPCVSPLQLQRGKKETGIIFFPKWNMQ